MAPIWHPYGTIEKGPDERTRLACEFMVGLTGFEPATSRSRTERSTKLSHNP